MGEHPPVVAVVLVVRVGVVGVEPEAVVIAFDVEDLEVAIGVREMYEASSTVTAR